MKPALALILLAGLAACAQPEQVAHIYRYPAGAEPAVTNYAVGSRLTGPARIVDYHNHALEAPEEGFRWQLVSGAFLLTRADGLIRQVVPSSYRGG